MRNCIHSVHLCTKNKWHTDRHTTCRCPCQACSADMAPFCLATTRIVAHENVDLKLGTPLPVRVSMPASMSQWGCLPKKVNNPCKAAKDGAVCLRRNSILSHYETQTNLEPSTFKQSKHCQRMGCSWLGECFNKSNDDATHTQCMNQYLLQ